MLILLDNLELAVNNSDLKVRAPINSHYSPDVMAYSFAVRCIHLNLMIGIVVCYGFEGFFGFPRHVGVSGSVFADYVGEFV